MKPDLLLKKTLIVWIKMKPLYWDIIEHCSKKAKIDELEVLDFREKPQNDRIVGWGYYSVKGSWELVTWCRNANTNENTLLPNKIFWIFAYRVHLVLPLTQSELKKIVINSVDNFPIIISYYLINNQNLKNVSIKHNLPDLLSKRNLLVS